MIAPSIVHLSALVRDIVADAEDQSTEALVAVVLDKVTGEDPAELFRQALPYVVREVRSQRPHRRLPPTAGQPSRPSRSTKVARVREAWRARLRDSVEISPEHRRKFLGDCTEADLAHAASVSDRMAEANAATARTYRQLATALAEHHAEFVGRLPETVLRSLLGDE